MPLHATIYFGVLAGLTTLVASVPRAISARIWIGWPLGIAVIGVVASASWLLTHERDADVALGVVAVVVTLAFKSLLRRWSWLGAQLFATTTLASIAYLLYAGSITYGVANDFVYLVASSFLLILEVAALGLSVSYLFEIVDTLSRSSETAHAIDPTYLPHVAIQVPAYNEPIELVSETLDSLAALDYPNLIVQVVDNNTPDPDNWKALQAHCEKLGSRFQFMHLENWPGFKAGALNEATRRLPPDVEVIGVVDADYVVEPNWLRSVIGHFADPLIAFVQTPQNYRDWSDDQYLRGLYYSYQYFFDITMPARAHRNAIIFAGTMGLIRRRVLEEIGGWNPDIVTEDAEASLRMLARGYAAVYVPQAYGHGLMPLSFDGLKKQRFRWALGGVQILRLHWRRLLLGTQAGRLTVPQRVHYLLGNVQWFGDVLMFCFTLLLLLTAISTSMHQQLPIRQLTGVALALPVIFLVSGLFRAVWAMKLRTRCTWRDSIAGLQVWFALSWVVTLACLRGVVSFRAAFLRTPKERTGEGSLVKAIRASEVETMLAALGLAVSIVMLARVPSIATAAIAGLLLFQAAVYANAPWAGVSAEGIRLTPLRRAYRTSAQNTGARPPYGASAFAVPAAAAVVGLTLIVIASIATPPAPPETHSPAPAQARPTPSTTPVPTLTSSQARTASPGRTSPPQTTSSPSPTPS